MQALTTKEPTADMVEVAIQSVEHVFNWRKYLEDMRKDPHWNDKKACKSRRSCGKDPYDIEDPT